MNNLLLILGLLALSNGNVSLFGNKDKNVSNESLKIDKKDTKKLVQKTKKSSRDNENRNNKNNQSRKLSSSLNSNTKKIKKIKKIRKNSKHKNRKLDNPIQYNVNDIKAGIKLMDLSEEDLDRGMEIITRTKKYMSSEERKMLIKMESILDLVKGIKKLNDVDILEKEDESEFFRNMDEEDKKNMMIKEILEVFPEKRKESVEKAIDMKKKIDLFAELFLPEDGEGGFSLSSLADISNLGSSNNIKLLGSLLRGDNLESDEDNDEIEEYDEEYNEDDYQYGEYYEEYENGYNKNRYD
ncbi:hypothetical protein [Intestinibacter bartlettii]|uniref:DUF5667 domain-containing protein n=1 Tax=Intestinibacter bartlettii TaxID=261299 RepID=A0ABS8CT09_9FIRM|nr:hypothetical protein [Intestinibacter bartlettii]MCB5395799.1 hypothetical protein [Intestinibacter bartlettii]MCB5402348.1 hypothetical protein [Intestinibacter bartlettii]MCB5444604.1 hypothetical protein [Intestinibacter bartlettii]MCB5721560.1 hypothetical protein [Intestinibacter bartlettii]MCB5747782.1 hypothetical protein [Intestinibacter bartlettii]